LAGYFTGFYPHIPFTHLPTFKLEACSPELCLAMMALGALDRFENTSATQLFYFSKALLLDSQQRRAQADVEGHVEQSIDEVRCLLCLAHFATWQSNQSLKTEACVLQSLLVLALRLSGLEQVKQSRRDISWEEWSQDESERRTKLLAFCFLGIQSIAYDVPPSIWCYEIDLQLPCSCPEWTAPNATTWNLLRENTPCQQGQFRETLDSLLSVAYPVSHSTSTPTPVGNYILLHGLLQKIIWTPRLVSGTWSRKSSSQDCQSIFEYGSPHLCSKV
jgi:hypothetical protein